MTNANLLIKVEQGITDNNNWSEKGLSNAELLQIAQSSFKRRQRFVTKAVK